MTKQTNWTEYSGSDDKIAELSKSKRFLLRYKSGREINWDSSILKKQDVIDEYFKDATQYWLIPDDPLREMKVQWAMTKQPVWVRCYHQGTCRSEWTDYPPTTEPDWYLGEYAEYSFTEFKD